MLNSSKNPTECPSSNTQSPLPILQHKNFKSRALFILFIFIIPLIDQLLPQELRIAEKVRIIFIFSILALGLHIVTGLTGLLNLGVSAFMAIGVYIFSILTCDIYPFQLGFWKGTLCAVLIGSLVGLFVGLPTLRLRGDYLAIVTLGFGEIVQDALRNLEVITKGTQGINPLPGPSIFGYSLSSTSLYCWYYLLFFILIFCFWLTYNIQKSRLGRVFIALREDEIVSRSMGISPLRTKLIAFSLCAGFCALSGALWASLLGSSGEPGNYDFQVSILALCIVIVGGIGDLYGVFVGAVVMLGISSIVLVKLSEYLVKLNLVTSQSVLLSPSNWKYMIFGLALVLMMRFKPKGLCGE